MLYMVHWILSGPWFILVFGYFALLSVQSFWQPYFQMQKGNDIGAQPEIFQRKGGFLKLGHFDKRFFKNSRKKGPAGKIFS